MLPDNAADIVRLIREPMNTDDKELGERLAKQFEADLADYAEHKYVAQRITVVVESTMDGVYKAKKHVIEGPLVYSLMTFTNIHSGLQGLLVSALSKKES